MLVADDRELAGRQALGRHCRSSPRGSSSTPRSWCGADAGIETPADLKGKRVGVPEYQQTAALWTRGVLQHEFGVEPKDMEFWMERTPDRSHGGATGFKPPPGVTVHQIPADKNIGSMMVAASSTRRCSICPAATSSIAAASISRTIPTSSRCSPTRSPRASRYYRKTGIFPINHGMVVRREIAEKQPWVVLNLLKAFNEANDIADAQRIEHVEYHLATGLLAGDANTALLHHGVKANRKVLETIAQYSLEQGLTPRLMKLDELYAPNALES